MRDSLTAGEQIAGYRIESFVARGGMAVVYCARDVELDRRVALKVLAPELAEDESFRLRFERESQIAASIDHPNIIPIYEAGQADDLLYLAMRFVEGMDLRQVMTDEGPLSLDRALQLFAQVAGALDAAHAHGLVHRDVKPGNVLVAPTSRSSVPEHVYLTDFGLTKRASSLSGLTATGFVIGTIDYMAPEQITGQPVDGRADVYALGCVLYEALTGHRPFERELDAAALYAHVTTEPPTVTAARPDLPRLVDQVVAKAMAKAPADRYATCRELIADLRAGREEQQASAALDDHGAHDHRQRVPFIPAPAPPAPISGPTRQPLTSGVANGEPADGVPGDRPAEEERNAVRRGRRKLLVLAVVGLLLAASAGVVFWVRESTPPTVTLQFPLEEYPRLGMTVARTWTLSGDDGDRLHGELLIHSDRSQPVAWTEALPKSMIVGPEKISRNGTLKNISGGRVLLFTIEATAGQGHRLTYDLDIPAGPVTQERLRALAAERTRAAEKQ